LKYATLQPITVKKYGQKIELQTGQVILLPEDKATKLIQIGKIKPLIDVMGESYRELCRRLKSYPVTAEEIQEHSPELLRDIHKTIDELDKHFLNENLQGFNDAMENIKRLYLEAMNNILKNRG